MKTAQEALEFLSEYTEFYLAEAEKEQNPTKAREMYQKHDGMRTLINELIDAMSIKNDNQDFEQLLDAIDKEPILDEVLNKGKTVEIETWDGCKFNSMEIKRYKGTLYYIRYVGEECISFKKLS